MYNCIYTDYRLMMVVRIDLACGSGMFSKHIDRVCALSQAWPSVAASLSVHLDVWASSKSLKTDGIRWKMEHFSLAQTGTSSNYIELLEWLLFEHHIIHQLGVSQKPSAWLEEINPSKGPIFA